PTARAASSAPTLSLTPADRPLARQNRQNSTMWEARGSCCEVILSCLRDQIGHARLGNFASVFYGLGQAAACCFHGSRIERATIKVHQPLRPVQGLRDSRRLAQLQLAYGLDKTNNLIAQLAGDAGQARAHDPEFLFQARILDPVVKATALQGVTQFAAAI